MIEHFESLKDQTLFSNDVLKNIYIQQDKILIECGFPCEGMNCKVRPDGSEEFYKHNRLVVVFGPLQYKSKIEGKKIVMEVTRGIRITDERI